MSWKTKCAATLENEHVELRRISPDDRDQLRSVAFDPDIWRYFVFSISNDAQLDQFIVDALNDTESGARAVFCIVQKPSGTIVGSMAYGNMAEKEKRLEIGWSWLGKEFRGAGLNRWAKFLLLQHAFEMLGCERVEFKTDVLNAQARKGLQNIGAIEEGVLRSYNFMPDNRRRNAVYYSILKAEWPFVKESLLNQPKVLRQSVSVLTADDLGNHSRSVGASRQAFSSEIGNMHLQIGMLLFPQLTQLDLTGPFEVLSRLSETRVLLLWKSLEPITSDTGMSILPTSTFNECPQLDVVFVPGGPGQVALMEDDEVLGFLRDQAREAMYVTSVCTGSLVLAAAGLLNGRRAACHWMFRDLLSELDVDVSEERYVVDGNRVTGGGVTSGIDFGLKLAAMLRGETEAKQIQLQIEYNPAPPFDAGTPQLAGEEIEHAVRQRAARLQEVRRATVERVKSRLS